MSDSNGLFLNNDDNNGSESNNNDSNDNLNGNSANNETQNSNTNGENGQHQNGSSTVDPDQQESQDNQGDNNMTEDADLLELKQRVKGMDEEAARLIQLQNEMEQEMKSTASPISNSKN
jgi:hypothetical protein